MKIRPVILKGFVAVLAILTLFFLVKMFIETQDSGQKEESTSVEETAAPAAEAQDVEAGSAEEEDPVAEAADAEEEVAAPPAEEAQDVEAGSAEEEDPVAEAADAEEEAAAAPAEDNLTAIALVVLSVTTLVAVAISFYLYRWRKILLAGPHMTLPEELGGYIRNLGNNVAELDHSVVGGLDRLHEQTGESSKKVGIMTETFMTLQDAVNLRDSEINRLKTGYDAAIFRRFLRRFIRVDRAIQDFLNDTDGETDNLRSIERLLEDALDECGVERFNPEIGEDYRAKGDEIADNPKEIPTTNPGQDFQVAEIVESGYRLRGADNSQQIIVPAKVRVYRHRN